MNETTDCGAAKGSARAPRQVTTHNIDVQAIASGNSIEWKVGGKKPEEAKLKLPRDSGAHEIKFDLDRDGPLKDRGLRFNCAYPIFVHDDVNRCPGGGVDDQIEVLACSTDKLTILDKNTGDPKQLRYQLNFVEENGEKQVCDPIIDNGGGSAR